MLTPVRGSELQNLELVSQGRPSGYPEIQGDNRRGSDNHPSVQGIIDGLNGLASGALQAGPLVLTQSQTYSKINPQITIAREGWKKGIEESFEKNLLPHSIPGRIGDLLCLRDRLFLSGLTFPR